MENKAQKKKRVGRPRTGQRPVIAMRVHQPTYDKIQKAAADSRLSISEEAERRLEQSFDPEGVLQEKGFSLVRLDEGDVWVPPNMPGIFNLRISVDAATIASEMGCPGLQPLIEQALRNIAKKRGIQS